MATCLSGLQSGWPAKPAEAVVPEVGAVSVVAPEGSEAEEVLVASAVAASAVAEPEEAGKEKHTF